MNFAFTKRILNFWSIILLPILVYSQNLPYVQVNQGWGPDDQALAFHLDVGTEVVPARWFFALEAPDTTEKLTTKMQDFGFIADSTQLPIGITIHEQELTSRLYSEKQWVGVNCTACHTSVLKINDHSVLINGNQSLFRIQEFEESLVKSVNSTLADSKKFDRFARDLGNQDRKRLLTDLNNFKNEFDGWNQRNHHYRDKNGGEVRYGPGRLDGLGGATNDFNCYLPNRLGDNDRFGGLIVNPKNCRTSQPPTSIPHLWGMAQQQYAQWDARVHSSIGRNVGAMMAGYGKNWIEVTDGKIDFKTTVNVDNVVRFEELYKRLKTPLWKDLADQNIVPHLDPESISRGKVIYAKACLSCHSIQPESTAPNSFGNSYWKSTIFPAPMVGTEENHLNADRERRAIIPTALADRYRQSFGNEAVAADGTVSGQISRSFFVGATLQSYFIDNKIPLEKIALMSNCRDNSFVQTQSGLKAKSLEGIVWTAPFLHNGSVPTLMDLLKTAHNRPKQFYMGCQNYDVSEVGYSCDKSSQNGFLFDTRLEGNSNKGHEYGTDLNNFEKEDLITYLKSLEQPELPSPQNPFCN
jgi:hypothetical protein